MQPGDTLESISHSVYGTPDYVDEIRSVNADRIGNVEELEPGLVLVLPNEAGDDEMGEDAVGEEDLPAEE